jgi:hypothetical protein
MRVHKIDEVAAFRTMRNTLAELMKGYIRIRKISAPGLALGIVEGHSRGEPEVIVPRVGSI